MFNLECSIKIGSYPECPVGLSSDSSPGAGRRSADEPEDITVQYKITPNSNFEQVGNVVVAKNPTPEIISGGSTLHVFFLAILNCLIL